MTTLDLVERAEHRATIAGVLGTLVLTEPGPHLAGLVDGIAELQPLAMPGHVDSAAVEYERVFLREISPYASVFLGHDGRRGGPIADVVTSAYADVDFTEHRDGTWRVAGADHLGLVLRCYAKLCSDEAAWWESDHPDQAVRAVEATRAYLDQHLGWAVVAAEAISDAGGRETPYGALGVSIAEFLHEEGQLLRPGADHPGMAAPEPDPPPSRVGPRHLAQLMLSPSRAGGWLSTADIASLASRRRVLWRASDPRSNLRFLIDSAGESGEIPDLAADLMSVVDGWSGAHRRREQRYDGAARIWRRWRTSAENTLAVLEGVRNGDLVDSEKDRPLVTTLEISGRLDAAAEGSIQAAIDDLRAVGLTVTMTGDLT